MAGRADWPVTPELREEWERIFAVLDYAESPRELTVSRELLTALYNEMLVATDAENRAKDARDNAVSAMRLQTTLTSAEQARAQALLGANRRLVGELGAVGETIKALVKSGSGETAGIAAYSRRVQTAL